MTDLRTYQNKTSTEPSEQEQSTTTSTTYYLPHGTARVLNPADLEQIRIVYNSVLGELNSIKARPIEEALEWGLDASAVIDAIEQTGFAPRPTYFYFRAILRRYMNERIMTAQEAKNDRFARFQKQQQEKWRRDEWFEHRDDEMPF